MNYLLIGNDDLINKNINDIVKKYGIEIDSISKYDLFNDSISNAIIDINTISLFDTRKMVIVYNINNIDNEEVLIKYLDNSNDNILVFVSNEKLNDKKSFVKKIKSCSTLIECFDIDLVGFIKDELKEYKISISNIMLLESYCNGDYLRIKNEIDKLKIYKSSTKEITDKDIKLLVKKSLDKNIFDLIKELNNKNFKEVISIYYDLKNNNEDDIKIISILAKQYRDILHVKILSNDTSDLEIMKLRDIKSSYRLKKLKEEGYKYSVNELKYVITSLSNLDVAIKSGRKNKNNGLEVLFARLCK